MRKKGVFLKYGVDLAFIRRKVVYSVTEKKDVAFVRFDKAADYPERCRFTATRRTRSVINSSPWYL